MKMKELIILFLLAAILFMWCMSDAQFVDPYRLKKKVESYREKFEEAVEEETITTTTINDDLIRTDMQKIIDFNRRLKEMRK